nr:hypothetical protein Iba_chr01fCG7570 [Ipomoea batatas]
MEARHAALRARHKGKATVVEKGKGKAVEVASPDPSLAARLPSASVVIGANPTTVALAAVQQPHLRTLGSKQNSDSSVPTSAKRARRPSEAIPEDPAAADKIFIFHRLEQLIIAADLQSLEGVSPTYLLQSAAYHNFHVQLFQAGLNNAIKGLAKDSKLPLQENSRITTEEGFTIVSKALKSAREDALREFKASKDFHKEAMAHAEMHARTIVDKWLEGEGLGHDLLPD